MWFVNSLGNTCYTLTYMIHLVHCIHALLCLIWTPLTSSWFFVFIHIWCYMFMFFFNICLLVRLCNLMVLYLALHVTMSRPLSRRLRRSGRHLRGSRVDPWRCHVDILLCQCSLHFGILPLLLDLVIWPSRPWDCFKLSLI